MITRNISGISNLPANVSAKEAPIVVFKRVIQSSMMAFRRLLPLLALIALPLAAQRGTGELRLTVKDPAGLPLEATGTVIGQATQVRMRFTTSAEGVYFIRALPFGAYRLQVERSGFAPFSGLVEIRSEAPLDYRVTLGVNVVETSVVVSDS